MDILRGALDKEIQEQLRRSFGMLALGIYRSSGLFDLGKSTKVVRFIFSLLRVSTAALSRIVSLYSGVADWVRNGFTL